MYRKAFDALAFSLVLTLFSPSCPAQELILGLKLGQSRQEALEALLQRGVEFQESSDYRHIDFRIRCESAVGKVIAHFDKNKTLDELYFTTGIISPASQSFFTLVPLVDGCYKHLSEIYEKSYGIAVAGGNVKYTTNDFDQCFERQGTVVYLVRYILGNNPNNYPDVQGAMAAMRGKIAQVHVTWEPLKEQTFEAGIDKSRECTDEINRRAATR